MSAPQVPQPEPAPGGVPGLALLRLAAVLAVGAALVWWWLDHIWTPRWADRVAFGLTLACWLGAVRLGLESLDRASLGRRMQVEGASTRAESRQARLSAVLLGLLGVVLILPALADNLGWPRPAAYVGVTLFAAVRLAYTWRVTRTGDEFLKRRLHENSWRILTLASLGLLLYGGAERLGLVPPGDVWDVFILVTTLSILVPALSATRWRN